MHRLNGVPATPDFSSIILLPIASRDHLGSDALRERRRWIGFLNDLFYGRSYIVAPAELSISFLLDEKSTVVPVRLAGEQSGDKRKVSYGEAQSNSERAAPAACVGKRFSAVRLSGIDRLDAPAHAAGRGSAGPDDCEISNKHHV